MSVQAQRLTRDLDRCVEVLDNIKGIANDVTSGYDNENLRFAAGKVAHASCVLDGLVTQGRRIDGALASLVSESSSSGGGGRSGGRRATEDKIVYVLSILDGLNVQIHRLDVGETFGVLDEINAKAGRAFL